ncbi:MAG: glycoside hydrolase family 88 protein [Cyclobacteriaceae bacterium]
MKPRWIFVALSVGLFSCSPDSQNAKEDQNTENASQEEVSNKLSLDLVKKRLPHMLDYKLGAEAFPRSMEPTGEVRQVPSKDWTSGFYPGSLLFLSQLTDNDQYLNKAQSWLPHIEKEQYNDKTHDMGFKVYCSIGNAYRLTNNEEYASVIIKSAETLSTRFNENVGAIKSWDFGKNKWTFPVIIDNMMNLELLFEATKLSGDSSFYRIADSHASVTLQNHFRSNNSSYHVIDYDPNTGEVVNKLTHQGLNTESSWARGQAWGLYGFTMAYRYTQNESYLAQAEAIAAFITDHPRLSADKIPYWDFDDPQIPDAPRDASAAAVIASALMELATYSSTSHEYYEQQASLILETLSSEDYVLDENKNVPFILNHSTGNMPKNDEVDVPMSYADYYFLEALLRKGVKL